MLLLRWIIGIAVCLALLAFALILTVGKGIASAYRSGSGMEDIGRNLAIVAVPVVLVLMLLGVIQPQWRFVQNVASLGAMAGLVGCIFIGRESPGEALLYAVFLILWLLYYALNGRSI